MNQPSSEVLTQAANLLRAQKLTEARSVLADYLKQNPNSDAAWWLMSFAVTDREQKINCLERVLKLKPDHPKAQAKLDQLLGASAAAPAKEPVIQTAAKQPVSKGIPARAIVILGGFGLIIVFAIAFFAYQVFASSVDIPERAELPTSMVPTATLNAILPPTWTPTSTLPPQATRTPLPRTEIPIATETPTPDPNATSTPIPENKIGTSVGQYPPDFTLVNAITGEEVSLSDYTGQPVLILFLTTWCPSCQEEMHGVQDVYEKYYDQGFVVIGVGLGASRSALKNFAGRYGSDFPMLSDWDRDVARDYGVQYIPTNYFIRKNGKIWQSSVGMMATDELDTAVSGLLKVP